MTARTVQRLLGVSHPAARKAAEELADAGILARKPVERNTTGYLARDVFDLLTGTERRLGSTSGTPKSLRRLAPFPLAPLPTAALELHGGLRQR